LYGIEIVPFYGCRCNWVEIVPLYGIEIVPLYGCRWNWVEIVPLYGLNCMVCKIFLGWIKNLRREKKIEILLGNKMYDTKPPNQVY